MTNSKAEGDSRGKVTSYGHIARLLGRREYEAAATRDKSEIDTDKRTVQLSVPGMQATKAPSTLQGRGLIGVGDRQVGVCLKHLPSYSAVETPFYNNRSVPWQRVINSKGVISPR